MRLLLDFEGKTYDFDLDDISVGQAKVVKDNCGLTLLGLRQGLMLGDADALRAAYWYMKTAAGEQCNLNEADFKAVRFYNATQEAVAKANEASEANAPKEEDRQT